MSNERNTVSDLGLILSDFSSRAAAEYNRVVLEVLREIAPDELPGWVGMGIQIVQHSTAAGIRYFREGPEIFSKISNRKTRESFIQLGIQLAQRDPNRALAYYQHAPALLAMVTDDPEVLHAWAEGGMSLSDYTLAVEYFKETPSLLRSLPMHLLAPWIKVASTLAASKLFFAVTYIRISSEIFSKIKTHQRLLLQLIDDMAQIDSERAMTLYKESPGILSIFPENLAGSVLEKVRQIALVDSEAAYALFLNSPRIISEISAATFPEWVEHGMTLLRGGSGVGYFTFESKSAKDFAKGLKGGVYLSDCVNVLESFARALSGRPVTIRPNEDDVATTDGQTIYLPPHYANFQDNAQNFEWYKLATAFQAGYIEFGTYSSSEEQRPASVGRGEEGVIAHNKDFLFGREVGEGFTGHNVAGLLAVRAGLFDIAEGARVEFLLREEYPGLREPLSRMREQELANRPLLTDLFQRKPSPSPMGEVLEQEDRLKIIIEILLQISLAGKTKEPIPPELSSIVFECCQILGAVQQIGADVTSSMKAARAVYHLLLGDADLSDVMDKPMEPFEEKGGPTRGSGTGSGAGKIKPSIRGVIDPERVAKKDAVTSPLPLAAITLTTQEPSTTPTDSVISTTSGSTPSSPITSASTPSSMPQPQASTDPMEAADSQPKLGEGRLEGLSVRYDEWDAVAGDYRVDFCQVIEKEFLRQRPGEIHLEEAFVEQVISEYGGMIKLIRKQFQSLVPERFVLHKGVLEGEIIDHDRLIENRVERCAGISPSGRIYIERRKNERSVATAVLVDFSGSTQQRLPCGKSILQVEQEALILLSHAMHAVGDRFALYGFSGQGNNAVDFYILKDFQTRFTVDVDRSVGRAKPLFQNRDGAAIRHAVSKLSREEVQTRILILLTDGKPLDDQYNGSYAIADTKKALREARNVGIRPFGITVDQSGAEYLKGMYGEVAYQVVDQIESLPKKLPLLYKRLTR